MYYSTCFDAGCAAPFRVRRRAGYDLPKMCFYSKNNVWLAVCYHAPIIDWATKWEES